MADSGEGGKDPARTPPTPNPPPPTLKNQTNQIETAPSPHLSQGLDKRAHPAHPSSEVLDPPLLSFVSGPSSLSPIFCAIKLANYTS